MSSWSSQGRDSRFLDMRWYFVVAIIFIFVYPGGWLCVSVEVVCYLTFFVWIVYVTLDGNIIPVARTAFVRSK